MVTAIYVGNLDPSASVTDLSKEFEKYGKVSDIWVARKPPGFAFIEYDNEADANEAVRDMDGRYILDKKVRVEISRRGRARDKTGDFVLERGKALTHSDFRVKITGLSARSDWRSLKDFLRTVVDPLFVDTYGNGEGVAEFKYSEDIEKVISRLDDSKLDGNYIRIRKDNFYDNNLNRGARSQIEYGRERDLDRDRDFGRDRSYGRDKDSYSSRDVGRANNTDRRSNLGRDRSRSRDRQRDEVGRDRRDRSRS